MRMMAAASSGRLNEQIQALAKQPMHVSYAYDLKWPLKMKGPPVKCVVGPLVSDALCPACICGLYPSSLGLQEPGC